MAPTATMQFWSWFRAHAGDIDRALTSGDTAVVSVIDSNLRAALPDARWEVGPDGEEGWFFALSLAGDLRMLERNRTFVSAAPSMSNWRFPASKPPKAWSSRTLMFGDREISFEDWRLHLRDSVVEYVPTPRQRSQMSRDELDGACWFLLEAELGELEAMSSIDDVCSVASVADGFGPSGLRSAWENLTRERSS